MLNFIINHLQEIIIYIMISLCVIWSLFIVVIKKFGQHTNIDDPLDEKFWKKHNKDWFIDRIGKTIYRNETTCTCDTCKYVTDKGLVIRDEFHVDYLLMVQGELGIEYRDIK